MTGPVIPIAVWADEEKYRQPGESFNQKCGRVAGDLTDGHEHYTIFNEILKDQRFLPGGRVQSAAGSFRQVTAFNCFVMQKVPDSLDGIMDVAKEAAKTMQLGGGVGYDFSSIRPKGSRIKSLGSNASGPLSFMGIFDALCKTIASAGHRRGAQMGCMRVDHPDIMDFITAKNNEHVLTQFNMSVLVTDKFMEAVKKKESFDLVFEGRVFDTVDASNLWDAILRSTWDWAEPGVIFVDRINEMNNLWWLEDITATNPCGEQPLPPYGACLLGSVNWTKYVKFGTDGQPMFDYDLLAHDIPHIVRAMDNVIDKTIYPLKEQEREAKDKRRMGLGHTGVANALTFLGYKYGSPKALAFVDGVMSMFAEHVYTASVSLAIEKGPFPLFDPEMYCQSKFIQRLSPKLQKMIKEHGIRNSHLLSIAPTGTISLTANNVSSGIEPVWQYSYERTVQTGEGSFIEKVEDYAVREWGLRGETIDDVTVQQHVDMLTTATKWVDSAVSKTCNVGEHISWDEFKDVYMRAYEGGAKGCTTFRKNSKRAGILSSGTSENEVEEKPHPSDETIVEGGACYIDEFGMRSCE